MNDIATEYRRLIHLARTSKDGRIAQAAMRAAMAISNGPTGYTGGASREPFDVGHTTIQTDQIHPPSPADSVVPLMAPSRILVVPNLVPVIPGDTVTGLPLEFSAGGGWLIGWRGRVSQLTAPPFSSGQIEQDTLGVRMFINDGEELITNGQVADFATFGELFASATHITPIMRRVDVKDTLSFAFRNFQPPGGATLTPRICFYFWREKYPGT
jgi:hypothetical protein